MRLFHFARSQVIINSFIDEVIADLLRVENSFLHNDTFEFYHHHLIFHPIYDDYFTENREKTKQKNNSNKLIDDGLWYYGCFQIISNHEKNIQRQ